MERGRRPQIPSMQLRGRRYCIFSARKLDKPIASVVFVNDRTLFDRTDFRSDILDCVATDFWIIRSEAEKDGVFDVFATPSFAFSLWIFGGW